MIPLGSCTMKLNATAEMIPMSPGQNLRQNSSFCTSCSNQRLSSIYLINLENHGSLKSTTGFAGVSLQPNAGSQGEYAGLHGHS